ncbi:MAG: DUF1176 domain-containing protein [Pseudomonadota bacterium]
MSILIALSLAAASPPIADIPQPVEFRDWIAVCNNLRDCEAIAAKPDTAQGSNWTLVVKRRAAASDKPEISATPSFDFYEKPTTIRIDGRKTHFALDKAGYLVSEPMAFLKAIARARSAQVIGEDGQVLGDLPVMGATASLRWIDDRQERVGTITAMVAGGTKPASAIPPPPRAPSIAQPDPSDAPARVLKPNDIAEIQKAGDCSRPVGKEAFFRLDANHSLGLIPCVLGAYQGFSMVVIVDEAGDWSFAPLEQPRKLDSTYRPIEPWMYSGVATAHFDSEKRILSEFARGRGLADCGQAAKWAWDGELFRLASFNEMRECRGTPPGDWPSLWVTENAQLSVAE